MPRETHCPQHLEARVRQLEDRVRALRASRRVLMDLLVVREEERKAQFARLEQENRRLRRRNSRYARTLLAEFIRSSRAGHGPAGRCSRPDR